MDKAWSILDAGVKANLTDKRAKAVRVLGLLSKDEKAAGLARTALGDARADVRVSAATALGQMGDATAIPALGTALQDKDFAVVLAAANSLVILKDRNGYETYSAILSRARRGGNGLWAQQSQVLRDPKKMAELGVSEGLGFVPFAGVGLSAIKAVTKDDASPIRAAAAKMLAADPDPSSGEALLRATKDKSWMVRAAALDAIARRNDPKPLETIVTALGDEKDVVRYTAAAAVIHLSSMVMTEPLPQPPAPAPPKKRTAKPPVKSAKPAAKPAQPAKPPVKAQPKPTP